MVFTSPKEVFQVEKWLTMSKGSDLKKKEKKKIQLNSYSAKLYTLPLPTNSVNNHYDEHKHKSHSVLLPNVSRVVTGNIREWSRLHLISCSS